MTLTSAGFRFTAQNQSTFLQPAVFKCCLKQNETKQKKNTVLLSHSIVAVLCFITVDQLSVLSSSILHVFRSAKPKLWHSNSFIFDSIEPEVA